MKITVNEDPAVTQPEITIRCAGTDERILRILSLLRAYDLKLTGIRDDQYHLLDAGEVLYAETVDRHCFLYTLSEVYETPLRLYELEDRLAGVDFFRSSKSMVISLNHVRSIRPELGGRLQLTMSNGEKLFVSRQYAGTLRGMLGL